MIDRQMRVIETHFAGGVDALSVGRRDIPQPLPTEVLVKVAAAGINAVDWKIRSGAFPSGALGSHPFVQGWDVAGTVESATRVTRFAPGDNVYGLIWFPRPGGGYGEYVTAPARQFARIPWNASFAQAAALPLAGLTAWQCSTDAAALQAGQRILITAAAGGVGHLACQIARHLGAVVTGTASAPKHEFVSTMGASRTVDYRTADLVDTVEPQDVVLDLLGGSQSIELIKVLRTGGTLVLTIGMPSRELTEAADKAGVRVVPFLVEPDGAGLDKITELFEAGALTVHIEETYPLEAVRIAHARAESGRTTGKLVLTLDESEESR